MNSLLSVKLCDYVTDAWLGGVRCPLRDGHTYNCFVKDTKPLTLNLQDVNNSQVTSEIIPLNKISENAEISLYALVQYRALLIVVNKTKFFTVTSPLDDLKFVDSRFDETKIAKDDVICIGVACSKVLVHPLILFYRKSTGNHVLSPVECLNNGNDAEYFSGWTESNVHGVVPDFAVGNIMIDIEVKNTAQYPGTSIIVMDSVAPTTALIGIYTRPSKSLTLIHVLSEPQNLYSVTISATFPCEMRPTVFSQPLNSMTIGMFVLGSFNGEARIFVGDHFVTMGNILQAGKCSSHSKLVALRPNRDNSMFLAVVENENGERNCYDCYVRIMPSGEIACEVLESLTKIPSRSTFWITAFGNILTNFASARQRELSVLQRRQNGDWTAFADALWRTAFGSDDPPAPTDSIAEESGDDGAWNALLESDEHAFLMSEDPALRCLWEAPKKNLFASRVQTVRWEGKYVFALSEELHLCYENSKMNTLRHPFLFELATLSLRVAELLNRHGLVEYYIREFPSLASTDSYERWNMTHTIDSPSDGKSVVLPPFFIYDWLRSSLASRSDSVTIPDSVEARHKCGLPSVARLWIVCNAIQLVNLRKRKSVQQLVEALEQRGLTSDVLEALPLGVALHIRELLQDPALNPPDSWSVPLLELVGRQDIAKQKRMHAYLSKKECEDDITSLQLALFNHGCGELPHLPDLPPDPALELKRGLLQQHSQPNGKNSSKEVCDGTECDDLLVQMRFPDERILEVKSMLQWSKRVTVPYEETVGVKWAAKQQTFLTKRSCATLSVPLGRGAFTLSLDRVDDMDKEDAEFEEYPPLMLDGRTPSGHDVYFENKPSLAILNWPLYHNGVARGLRIAADSSRTDTNVWQTLSKYTREAHASNAGFVLGAGLQGHLPRTPTARILELLAAQDEMLSVSVLLAMSVNNAGTANEQLARMLYMHAPFLHSEHSSAAHTTGLSRQAAVAADSVDMHPSIAEAAFVGLGYLFRGTGQQDVAEALVHELLLQPTLRAGKNRESYALSVGFGIGLICLGCGDNVQILEADKKVGSTVTKGGGSENTRGKGNYILDALAPLISGGRESVIQKNARKLERKIAEQSQKPLLFSTSGWMFTEVTAPGAIMAIALTYMGTQNESAAKAMCVPSSRVELETVPSHQLLLRVLGRCLINWNTIQVSESWLRAQLPSFLQDYDYHYPAKDRYAAEMFWAGITGASFAMALRGVGSTPPARDLLKKLCLSLVRQVTQSLECLRPVFGVFDVFLDNLCISLALVTAGTGDLDVLRLLRLFHVKSTFSGMAPYGHYLARNLAIGILFLGGGLLTFDQTKEAAASLLCALYPLWPISPDDNSYHMQAFRHLYADAVVNRLVVACDVDTLRPVPAGFSFVVSSTKKELMLSSEVVSPFTLPVRTERVFSINVLPKDYLPYTLRNNTPLWLVRAGTSAKCSPFVFFVKKQQHHDSGFSVWNMALRSCQEQEKEYHDNGTGSTQDALGLFGTLAKRVAGEDESGLARLVSTVLAQKHTLGDGGDEGMSFALRVILLLWAVSHSVADFSGVIQLPRPDVMADVGLLLCVPSRIVPSQVSATVRESLNKLLQASTSMMLQFIENGVLPPTPALRSQLFALLAYFNIPQRDQLNAFRIAWKKRIVYGQQSLSRGRLAELVSGVIPDASADTLSCMLNVLIHSELLERHLK